MGDNELQIFSDRLKELRQSLNMTQQDFVANIGITASALSAYEKNQKNPSISVVKRIAETYHVSVDWLCGLSAKKKYDDKIETYNDLFRILFEIEKSCEDCISIGLALDCLNPYGDYDPDKNCIAFLEDDAMKFLSEWAKMRKLHSEKIIDDEVYNLWKEKVLNKDYYFTPSGGFSDLVRTDAPDNIE